MAVTKTKLDIIFSKYIRLKAGGYCKRCGGYFGVKGLQAAHMFGRIRHTTRWDERNVYALCPGCHYELDTNPLKKASFLAEQLSIKEIEELERIANKTIKSYPIDKESLISELKEKIRMLENE